MKRMLAARGLLPALAQGIEFVHREESRHIAFGLYFLSRLIVAPQNRALSDVPGHDVGAEASHGAIYAGVNGRSAEPNPFGIQAAELAEYSQRQFATRTQKIVRARRRRWAI